MEMEKREIGVGARVGDLTVIEPTEQRKNGYMVWRCRCDCGGTILLDTRCLQRGTVTDCGCRKKVKPGTVDLTGQRFGRLVCLEATDQRCASGSVIWRCRCDCGAVCLVPLHQLRQGYTKSCGCLGHPPRKDLVGQRFGKLVVTEYAGKEKGVHRWRCRCDCGNETVVGQTLLQSGKTQSCGCLREETIRQNLKLVDGTSVAILMARKNRPPLKNNTSGFNGVYQNKKTGKWVAQITFQKKNYYLGSFSRREDAVEARKKGEKIYEKAIEKYQEESQSLSPKEKPGE